MNCESFVNILLVCVHMMAGVGVGGAYYAKVNWSISMYWYISSY